MSRIGIVGGVERTENAYREIAERAGHQLFFHGGHVAGRGSASLIELARRVDFLIVVTDVNSHGAVQLVRRAARKSGVRVALHRRCSPARFATILAELDGTAAPQPGAP
jgi:hypothetical protein